MSMPLALFVVAILNPADGPDPRAGDDGLSGSWRVESMVIRGQDRYNPALEMTWEFRGDSLVTSGKMPGADRAVTTVLTFTSDAAKEPKAIDVTAGGKPLFKGIYKFEGGRLLVCYNQKDRPSEFVSDAMSKNVIFRFRKN